MTKQKDRKDLPQNRKKNCNIYTDDNNNEINDCNNENNKEEENDEKSDENNHNKEDNNIHNPKKISLIEFLYKDKEPENTTLNSEVSEKLRKLRSWLGAELKAANNTNRNSSKALVLYKSPYELFIQTLHKCLLLFPNLFTKTKPFPLTHESDISHYTSLEIQEIDDDDIECGVEVDEDDIDEKGEKDGDDEEEGMREGIKMVGENFVMEKETEEMDAGILFKKSFTHKNNSWLDLQKGA